MKVSYHIAACILGMAVLACCTKDSSSGLDWSSIPKPQESQEDPGGSGDPGSQDEGPVKRADADNIVVAHRGGSAESKYPDNSLAGLKYCIDHSIYGCECDAYYTSDNNVIMAHANSSYQVNGLTPWDHTLAEIRKAGVLANGEQIPTLEDFLSLAARKGNCTKLFIDIKKLDASHLNYITLCAKRISEIVQETGTSDFVTFLCTGTNDNVAKSAKTYALAAGCDYQLNTGKTTKQLGQLGVDWGNYQSSSLISSYGGTGSIDPADFKAAGMYISVFFLDKNYYNAQSITETAMVDHYLEHRDLFRTICSNYPVWLVQRMKNK